MYYSNNRSHCWWMIVIIILLWLMNAYHPTKSVLRYPLIRLTMSLKKYYFNTGTTTIHIHQLVLFQGCLYLFHTSHHRHQFFSLPLRYELLLLPKLKQVMLLVHVQVVPHYAILWSLHKNLCALLLLLFCSNQNEAFHASPLTNLNRCALSLSLYTTFYYEQ